MKPETLFQLKPREEILEVIHESLVPHMHLFAIGLLWLIVPFFFLFPLFREGVFGVTVFFVLLLSGLFFFWRKVFMWTRTVLIVTDRRVVDIEQKGFFDRAVTESTFKQVDEVTYRVKGFVSTVFRYGIVRLHLRGSAADIEFKHIANPSRIHDLINDLREEHA